MNNIIETFANRLLAGNRGRLFFKKTDDPIHPFVILWKPEPKENTNSYLVKIIMSFKDYASAEKFWNEMEWNGINFLMKGEKIYYE